MQTVLNPDCVVTMKWSERDIKTAELVKGVET